MHITAHRDRGTAYSLDGDLATCTVSQTEIRRQVAEFTRRTLRSSTSTLAVCVLWVRAFFFVGPRLTPWATAEGV